MARALVYASTAPSKSPAPSRTSNTSAAGIREQASSRCQTAPVCRYDITEKSAPTPQQALPSVNQSARWNSRIIEKGLARPMEPAWYAPGASVVEMVEAILLDKHKIVPCSVFLQGEYGVRDLFVVCCDGLKGFPEPIEAVFPRTIVQPSPPSAS